MRAGRRASAAHLRAVPWLGHRTHGRLRARAMPWRGCSAAIPRAHSGRRRGAARSLRACQSQCWHHKCQQSLAVAVQPERVLWQLDKKRRTRGGAAPRPGDVPAMAGPRRANPRDLQRGRARLPGSTPLPRLLGLARRPARQRQASSGKLCLGSRLQSCAVCKRAAPRSGLPNIRSFWTGSSIQPRNIVCVSQYEDFQNMPSFPCGGLAWVPTSS